MKGVLILAMMIFLLPSFARAIVACEKETSVHLLKYDFLSPKYEYGYVPQGECQDLGVLQKDQTDAACADLVNYHGYECYQVTARFRKIYEDPYFVQKWRVCFACDQ